MDFYIFRHGLTYFSKNNIGYGEKVESAEILPEGVPALEKLGKHLKDIKTDFNVSSTYLRCRQTVAIVEKESGKKFDFEPLLHDYDPRNESVKFTAERIEKFYYDLIKKDYKSVAICTHGYPIAMLKSLILQGFTDLSKIQDYPETGSLLIIKDKEVEEIDFN